MTIDSNAVVINGDLLLLINLCGKQEASQSRKEGQEGP